MAIVGIYLAAGKSRRMGLDKRSLLVGMKTLGSLAIETALQSRLDCICIVTQEDDALSWLPDAVKREKKVVHLPCKLADEGLSASLKCGVTFAKSLHAEAIVILLADQPFITVQMIDEMIAYHKEQNRSEFVAPYFKGVPRPPILIASSVFPALLKLNGDRGARDLLRSGFYKGVKLPCSDQRLFYDVDTKEDYHSLIQNNN